MRELLADEANYRGATIAQDRSILALDFDVIYDYLHPDPSGPNSTRPDQQDSIELVGSMLQLDQVGFTILPGSLYEFAHHWSRLLGKLPRFKRASDFLDHLSQARSIRQQPKLHGVLANSARVWNLEARAVRRAATVLESRNYINVEELYAHINDLPRDHLAFDESFAYMQAVRSSPAKTLANQNDSINLAIVLDALAAGVHLPLVTRTNAVLKGFESIWRSRHASQPVPLAVLEPGLGLFRVGLRKATPRQLRELEQSLVTVVDRIGDYMTVVRRSRDRAIQCLPLAEIAELQDHIFNLVDSLSDVRAGIDASWSRPASEVPVYIDLDKLADEVLHASNELQEEIRSLLSRAQHIFSSAAKIVGSLAAKSSSAQDPLPLLEAVASFPIER